MNEAIMTLLCREQPVARAHNPAFATAVRAGQCAQRIAEGFLAVDAGLRSLARRAPQRFQDCDWQGSQFDTDEVQRLRQREAEATLLDLARSCGNELRQLAFWREVRRNYLSLIDGLPDTTFCRLFFNELVAEALGDDARLGRLTLEVGDVDEVSAADLRITELGHELAGGLRRVLDRLPLEAAWFDADACATRVAQELRARLPELEASAGATITLLDATFYRFTRAYVFGRIACQGRQLPLALALRNTADGVVVDHIMLDGAEIAVLFGNPRACFQVELEQVAGPLAFLQSLTPATPAAALLASLGRAI